MTASIGDLVRSDGETLPANQVAVWGRVDSTGTHVTIWVHVNPRYGHVSGFGSYSGIAYLDDPRALGANVPVDVHVRYPDISFVVTFSLIAAFAGFIWAWLVMAVLLVAAIPIVNAQVLANPDWRGDLAQYLALASLAGEAAIALTPTFAPSLSHLS